MDLKKAIEIVTDEGYGICDGRKRLEFDGEDPPGRKWWVVYKPGNTASLDKSEFNDLDAALQFFQG